MGKRGFWNFLGLPNYSDIQALSELCREQSDRLVRMDEEGRQNRQKLSEINSSICGIAEAIQHLEESTMAQFRSLEQRIQHNIDTQQDSLSIFIERVEKNQERVLQSEEQSLSMLKKEIETGLSDIKRLLADLHKQSDQSNQQLERPLERLISQGREHEELLKMLLVNSLGDDIEKMLGSEDTHSERITPTSNKPGNKSKAPESHYNPKNVNSDDAPRSLSANTFANILASSISGITDRT